MQRQRSFVTRLALSILLLAVCSGESFGQKRAQSQRGSDRPLKGSLSGIVTFEYDWSDPVYPITTVMDVSGTMTHLGKVQARFTHNPPVVMPEYMNGLVVFTAANGDELVGEYGPGLQPIEIVGGTGRFENATGTFTYIGIVEGEWDDGDPPLPIQPWYLWLDLEGTISYGKR